MNQGRDSQTAAGAGSWPSWLPVLCGAVLAAIVLHLGFGGKETHFEELALGEETSSYYARLDGLPIHCIGIADAGECIEGAQRRGLSRIALWLGNSQVHAVNQLREGQESAPPVLARRLRDHGVDLLTFSQPNASLQEHYVLFEYLRHRTHLDMLVLAVVFDDLRETGLRPDVTRALEDPATVQALRRTEVGDSLIRNHLELASTDADLAGLRNTIQEHSERILNGWLENNLEMWSLREEARGSVFVGLYRLRNTVLGINPTSKRPLIRGPYDANMAALEAILGSCREAGIRVLVYVAPLRVDVDAPYVPEEYAAFKEDIERRTVAGGARFANLEGLIPAEFWGLKESTSVGGEVEIDFMHFQAPGHIILAGKLGELMAEQWEQLR